MNKTISINLGGFFFHIDEDAYQKLSRYFDAVKRSLAPDGREEIMKDIESRIAELFQERIKNDKQVIGLIEIDAVIGIMGQPEDYKIDDEKTSYQSNTSTSSSSNYYYPSKRLFRDKENGMLGGVMAGLGHYLGIDALWLRIIMVILFFGFGTGLFVYIVLWVLVPEAITTTQKLEMRGEPINISNIRRRNHRTSSFIFASWIYYYRNSYDVFFYNARQLYFKQYSNAYWIRNATLGTRFISYFGFRNSFFLLAFIRIKVISKQFKINWKYRYLYTNCAMGYCSGNCNFIRN